MRHGSIRLRLLAGGAVAIALALLLATWNLSLLFERHTDRVALGDLNNRLEHLASTVERGRDGAPRLASAPHDPLYQRPYSGHYWEVTLGGQELRSRSLWDYDLPVPQTDAATWQGDLPGPSGETLLVLTRRLRMQTPTGEVPLRIAVAADRRELDRIRGDFIADLIPYSALLGLALLAGGALTVTVGLRPLSSLSARVRVLNAGGARRIGDDVPLEVLPLAREIDSLLDTREAELERARLRAGDLAHGLKTPLQALLAEAARLRAAGAAEPARGIEEIVRAMQGHVDRELARARLAAASAGSSDVLTVARSVIAVLQRTPRGQEVEIALSCPPGLHVRLGRGELTELLGALSENAAQHARGRVAVSATRDADRIRIRISDDGPGIEDGMLELVMDRGARLDERPDSTGMGLAIAFEICRAVGGSLTLSNLDPGFRAEVELPALA